MVFGSSRSAIFDMNNVVVGRLASIDNIDLFHTIVGIERRIGEDPVKVSGVPTTTHFHQIQTKYHPEGFNVITPFDPYSIGYMIFHKIPLVIMSNMNLKFERLQQDYDILTLGHGSLERLKPAEQRELLMDMMGIVKFAKDETASFSDLLTKLPLLKGGELQKALAKATGMPSSESEST